MPVGNINRSSGLIGPAGRPNSNSIRVDSDTDTLKFGTSASGTTEKEVADLTSTQTLTNKTLTNPVITGPASILTAITTLTAADSGKTIFLNSATEFAVTLPAPALGLNFRFIIKAAPSGASYTVVSAAAAEIIVGKVHSAAGDAGDVENTLGATTITFVDGQAVMGDRVDVESDGTNWYAVAYSSVAAGVTFTG